MENSLPDFIVIGTMKGGTTSLHKYLGTHPQVGVSKPKETNFFLDRNKKDLSWYRRCFEGDFRICGEVSPNYTKYPGFSGVPKRMHETLPNAKLIYLVRDPIERAISHYLHNWVKKRTSEPIEKAFLPVEESGYLNTSRYYYQITQYLKYYAQNNILLIQSERLRADRESIMAEIFQFIGVDPEIAVESTTLEEEYHVSADKRKKTAVASFLTESKVGQTLKDIGKRITPRKAVDQIKEIMWVDPKKPKLSEGVRLQAEDYLRDDIEKLRELTDKTFPGWSV